MIGGMDENPRAICSAAETPVERVSVRNCSLNNAPNTVAPFEPKYKMENGIRISGLVSR